MLNEMRFGTLTKESIVKFGKLKRQPKYEDGIEPTELCVEVFSSSTHWAAY
jgi:ATP-dependent DNA helicase PIF1